MMRKLALLVVGAALATAPNAHAQSECMTYTGQGFYTLCPPAGSSEDFWEFCLPLPRQWVTLPVRYTRNSPAKTACRL